jgi:HD-GYP domain-containing protein (c-di-GMP phosphodiesterase class II)
VRYHHEFFNGRGYPDRIAGNQIPIEARIVSVADAVEAMASDRPYQRARSTKYIIKELLTFSDTQFDPMVVDAAIQVLNETEGERIMTKTTQNADVQQQ